MGERNINPIHNIHTSKKYKEVIFINPYSFGAGADTNADAFIAAAGITDPVQQSAIRTLFASAKSNGYWSKILIWYLFVGGNAYAHSLNAKDPRDLDAAYRILWSGGITHNSNGATGAGGYGITYIPDNLTSSTNKSVSIYQRNTLSSPSGSSAGAEGGVSRFYTNFGNEDYSTFQQTQGAKTLVDSNNGLFLMCKNSEELFEYYRNTNKTLRTGTYSPTSGVWWLFSQSIGGADLSVANLAGFHYGEYFNDAQALAYQSDMQQFNTTLGRQV